MSPGDVFWDAGDRRDSPHPASAMVEAAARRSGPRPAGPVILSTRRRAVWLDFRWADGEGATPFDEAEWRLRGGSTAATSRLLRARVESVHSPVLDCGGSPPHRTGRVRRRCVRQGGRPELVPRRTRGRPAAAFRPDPGSDPTRALPHRQAAPRRKPQCSAHQARTPSQPGPSRKPWTDARGADLVRGRGGWPSRLYPPPRTGTRVATARGPIGHNTRQTTGQSRSGRPRASPHPFPGEGGTSPRTQREVPTAVGPFLPAGRENGQGLAAVASRVPMWPGTGASSTRTSTSRNPARVRKRAHTSGR